MDLEQVTLDDAVVAHRLLNMARVIRNLGLSITVGAAVRYVEGVGEESNDLERKSYVFKRQ